MGMNLKDHSEESISWKQYDKINKIATMDDVCETTITNITPTEIQVLDPDTYMTVDLKYNDDHNHNIGSQINVIKIKERIYIL